MDREISVECKKCSFKKTFKVGRFEKDSYYYPFEPYKKSYQEYEIFWCPKCSKLYNTDSVLDGILSSKSEKKGPHEHHCSKCGGVLQNVTDELEFIYNEMLDVLDILDLEKEIMSLKMSLDDFEKKPIKDNHLKIHLDKIDDGLKGFVDYVENIKKESDELKMLKCPKCKDGYLKVKNYWVMT